MIPFLRSKFNAEWTPAKYAGLLSLLERRFHEPTQFRHSETPVFLTKELVEKAGRAGQELVWQLLGNPNYLGASLAAVPEAYRAPNDTPRPLFIQADFGLDGDQNLKLVEIQGFPSLYGYQPVLSEAYREAYGLDADLWALPNSMSLDSYRELLSRAIVGEHEPENVVLMEVDPAQQKTRHDFVATRELLGIQIVDARNVRKQGNRLFYESGGKLVPIERIYNRVIADELDRRRIQLPFSFRDELAVEWAGHPNWFFRLSKFSLPYLKHPTAPESMFLSDASGIDDWSSWVLKPLYSFAGTGVVVGPTQEDIERIPVERRHEYLVQKRVHFEPCIATPEGTSKIEIRVMYIWLDELSPVNLIIRMGRGAQMGVDFNKGFGWVGASAAFISSGGDA